MAARGPFRGVYRTGMIIALLIAAVQMKSELAVAKSDGKNTGKEEKMAELVSTIAGKVKEINIKPGQMVTEDDEAFIIEAMKMENIMYSEAGVVKEILVKVGDSVEEDAVLAVVE
jgi:biotin carboxyl carrier protein